jgi:hypothetical protein
MRKFLTFAVLAAATLAVAGCAQFQAFGQRVENAYSSLTSTQINYNYVVAAVQSFEGLQAVGAAYLRLPTCTAKSGYACHDRRATAPINAAFLAGRLARNDAIAYMEAHPCDRVTSVCPLMPDGVYAGLRSAIAELQSLYDTYKVNLSGAR